MHKRSFDLKKLEKNEMKEHQLQQECEMETQRIIKQNKTRCAHGLRADVESKKVHASDENCIA